MSLGGRWGGAQGGHWRWQTAPDHALSQSPAARGAAARIGGAGRAGGWHRRAEGEPPDVEGLRANLGELGSSWGAS